MDGRPTVQENLAYSEVRLAAASGSCNPGDLKISLKDIWAPQMPQRALKLIILEICTDTTGLPQITICVKNSNGLDTELIES